MLSREERILGIGDHIRMALGSETDQRGRNRVRDGRLVMNRLRDTGERHCSRPLRWIVSLFPFHR